MTCKSNNVLDIQPLEWAKESYFSAEKLPQNKHQLCPHPYKNTSQLFKAWQCQLIYGTHQPPATEKGSFIEMCNENTPPSSSQDKRFIFHPRTISKTDPSLCCICEVTWQVGAKSCRTLINMHVTTCPEAREPTLTSQVFKFEGKIGTKKEVSKKRA